MNVYTIGFTRKSLQQFLGLLDEAGVTKLIDTRLRPTSQLSGFAKKDDLAFILRRFKGIEYQHEPRLAPSAEILDAYRESKDWHRYEFEFAKLMSEREMPMILAQAAATHEKIALLCSEAEPERCHRRLLADAYSTRNPSVEVVHLR